jgi:nucleotide-binding universal stress UspA family protein
LERILFCTGFSAHSLQAGAYALALAERQGACLTLLHVIKDPPPSKGERDQAAESARARLASLLPGSAQLACPPQFAVEFGPPAECILKVAADLEANLIVLGVRQPAGFVRRFKWATAYEVVSNAPCPVLTVRRTEPD